MYLTKEIKEEIFAKHGDVKNTGKAEAQIALFTFKISHLTEHLKKIVPTQHRAFTCIISR